MSKLADRIRKVSRLDAAPIGFGAGAVRRLTPTMLCLLRLSAGEAGKMAEAAAKGADFVIFDGIDAEELRGQAQKGEAVPLGVRVGQGQEGRVAVAAHREAGADFVVLDLESASGEALLEEGIGLVLAVGRDTPDTTLRLLGDLPVDALLVPMPDPPLTLGRLLELRRLSALSRTPLLMEVTPAIGASQLQAMRDAGVAGVILKGSTLDLLPDLRAAIASMPPRGHRREERPEAILPVQALAPTEEEQEDFP